MMLDGRFELTDLVARSNMASIFRANDRQTGGVVAIKVPLMALESDVAVSNASGVRRRSAPASTTRESSRLSKWTRPGAGPTS